MTAIAVVCWAAWLGAIPEHGWAVWITYLVSALVFTGFAIGEYIGDTLPKTPSRKDNGPLFARVAFAAVVGALVATSIYEPVAGGVIASVLGALVGAWGGYGLRTALARRVGQDLPIAIAESALVLSLAIVSVWEIHKGVLIDLKRGVV